MPVTTDGRVAALRANEEDELDVPRHSKEGDAKSQACGTDHTYRWDCRDERRETTTRFANRYVFVVSGRGQQRAKLSAITRMWGNVRQGWTTLALRARRSDRNADALSCASVLLVRSFVASHG